ncbi:MAG: hypothetical protein PHY09_12075 [Desulfuromonadaceae bacterium]|nr:hypothetical protein [Desulfuromonadaceae bacterium]MDD5107316.1 hypothetical protein [Desulfuromonadaceae bacterium]
MNRSAIITGFLILNLVNLSLAVEIPPASAQRLVQLEQRLEKAAAATAGEYAKSFLDAAKAAIADAKINIAAGKGNLATLQTDLAEIQLNAADAKGATKELLEKIAVRRSELKKMEARLERFRNGEDD